MVNNQRMCSRVFIVFGFLFVLSGCIYNDEPMPEIAYDYTQSSSVQHAIVKPAETRPDIDENIPREWLPSPQVEKKWTAIVIHHSGTESGSAAIFDKWHKSRHWAGVGYDFVLGNGTNSGDGQVEVTIRWQKQQTGAHCGGTPGNWANKNAIGICLVGNFNNTVPTVRQMQSLLNLVRFLQKRYGIPKSRIYGHKDTPGAQITECPGRKFPMDKLKSMLDF
jgi:hypothetical protein